MAAIPLPSFVERYLSRPDLTIRLFPFLADQRISPVSPPAYVDALVRARDAYLVFDYKTVIIILDGIIQDVARQPLIQPRSRREEDPDHKRLLTLRDTLLLFERTASWLGVRYFFEGKHEDRGYEILSDVERIEKCIGTTPTIYVARAFRQQRMGKYLQAQSSIEQGLALKQNNLTERFLLDSKASLALRLGFRKEAARLYGQVSSLDEFVTISSESQGLATAFRGISEFGLTPDNSTRGLPDVFEGLRVCTEANHPGFEFQIRNALLDMFVERKDFDAALYMLSALRRPAKALHPGHKRDYAAIELFVRSLTQTECLGFTATKSELIERLPAIRSSLNCKTKPIREVIERGLDSLIRGDIHASRLWTALAAEAVTNGLVDLHDFALRKGTLDAKNRALFSAGIYWLPELNLIDDLRMVRNELAHGRHDGLSSNRFGGLLNIFQSFYSLCELVASSGLGEHQLSEATDKQALRHFFQT